MQPAGHGRMTTPASPCFVLGSAFAPWQRPSSADKFSGHDQCAGCLRIHILAMKNRHRSRADFVMGMITNATS
jgi:hypothetical protein